MFHMEAFVLLRNDENSLADLYFTNYKSFEYVCILAEVV